MMNKGYIAGKETPCQLSNLPTFQLLPGNLEFTCIDHFTGWIGDVVDVHTAGKIIKTKGGFLIYVWLLCHLLSEKIEDRNGQSFLVALLKIESDVGCGRVRI